VITIHLKNLIGYVYNQDKYRNADGTLNDAGISLIRSGNWVNHGWVTLTLQTALTEKARLELDENTEITNTATINADGLKKDFYTSTATVKPGISTITKEMASQEAPAYVEFKLDINKSEMDLDPNQDTVTVYDKMGENLYLAPDHTNYMKVYDMTGVTDDDLSKAKELTTDEYTVKIGDGGNNFEITVPDDKYIKVVYWAKFVGSASGTYSNTADFFYEGVNSSESNRVWTNSLKVQLADASAWSTPYVYVYKYDQTGTPINGVKFELYEVTVDTDGKVTLGNKLATKTTGSDSNADGKNGMVYFGNRDGGYTLSHDKLYCIVEDPSSVPAGGAATDPYYFELPDIYDHDASGNPTGINEKKQAAHITTHPAGVNVNDLLSGDTIGIVNTISVPSFTIPLNKTINGSNAASGVDFTFTLKQASGGTAYTEENTAAELIATGITVTNDGSGKVDFDALYFPFTGEYTFTLSENDTDAEGFTKDRTEYTVKITVGTDGATNTLCVESAKFYVGSEEKGDLMTGAVPTFDNTFKSTGSFEVTLHKEITNWPEGLDMPEFTFEVYREGKKLEGISNNDKGTITNDKNGTITFTIPVTNDDLGTDQRYVIKEVAGDDSWFTYDTDSVVVAVDIALGADRKLSGSNIVYKTKDGIFTNAYNASGSITLDGTKYLFGPNNAVGTVQAGQFTFTVKEGKEIVATGKTKADGSIGFTSINYVAAQIGEHTYTITEDKGSELFQKYDADPVTVVVTVTDDGTGTGKLKAEVKSVNGKEGDPITFTNHCDYIIPTGIRLDVLPYALILILALGIGGLLLKRRRKRVE
jgi:pilin isopeptide linkage protein